MIIYYRHLLAALSLVLLPCAARAQSNAAKSDPIQQENALVAQARAAARANDDSATDRLLQTPTSLPGSPAPSALFARRAAMLCACLQNEDDRPRALNVARRIVAQLASLQESTDDDREERLYWEACLEAHILDHKVRAIALLRTAEKIRPNDARVTDLELSLVSALNAFGH